MQCTNNLKQLGLAVHNYHDTYKSLPARAGGTEGPTNLDNQGWLSGWIVLLPFYEQAPMYEQITAGDLANGIPSLGTAHRQCLGSLECITRGTHCPSDSRRYDDTNRRLNNYCFSSGDDARNNDDQNASNTRGMFGHLFWYQFSDVIDGLSNTVMLSEKARCGNNTGGYTVTATELDHRFGHAIRDVRPNPALCLTLTDGRYYVAGTTVERTFGSRFPRGRFNRTGFNTVLPPNGPSCLMDVNNTG